MTQSPAVPPAHFEDIDSAMAALRAHGLRVTMARRAVLRALFAASEPVSVEAILASAAAEGTALDAASVYRNLESFERAGVARHVHLGHGAGVYALIGGGEFEYLYCERCGAARAIDPGELDDVRALVRSRFGHSARFTHFPIVGLCASCTAATAGRTRGGGAGGGGAG